MNDRSETQGLERPRDLARRLKLGHEEFSQRLLTSLILDGPYPRWNTRSRPSVSGLKFLETLWRTCGFTEWPGSDLWFVDEFDLPAREDETRGGSPDYAVSWDDNLWLIELKTDPASHVASQLPLYCELAAHHHHRATLHLTYLTPPMSTSFTPPREVSFAHVTWPSAAEIVRSTWPAGTRADVDAVVDGLLGVLAPLGTRRPSEILAELRDGEATELPHESTPEAGTSRRSSLEEEALEAAAATAADGNQRAVGTLESLDTLHELRADVRQHLAGSPVDSTLRYVLPWLWRWGSGGKPLTPEGEVTGYELRLSRYAQPRY